MPAPSRHRWRRFDGEDWTEKARRRRLDGILREEISWGRLGGGDFEGAAIFAYSSVSISIISFTILLTFLPNLFTTCSSKTLLKALTSPAAPSPPRPLQTCSPPQLSSQIPHATPVPSCPPLTPPTPAKLHRTPPASHSGPGTRFLPLIHHNRCYALPSTRI